MIRRRQGNEKKTRMCSAFVSVASLGLFASLEASALPASHALPRKNRSARAGSFALSRIPSISR